MLSPKQKWWGLWCGNFHVSVRQPRALAFSPKSDHCLFLWTILRGSKGPASSGLDTCPSILHGVFRVLYPEGEKDSGPSLFSPSLPRPCQAASWASRVLQAHPSWAPSSDRSPCFLQSPLFSRTALGNNAVTLQHRVIYFPSSSPSKASPAFTVQGSFACLSL